MVHAVTLLISLHTSYSMYNGTRSHGHQCEVWNVLNRSGTLFLQIVLAVRQLQTSIAHYCI